MGTKAAVSVGKAGSILVDRILFCHEASIASCNFCSLLHVPCIVFTTHANITLGSHHGFGTLSMFERLTDGIKSQLSPGDDHSTLDVRTCCSLWYVYAGVRRSFFSLFDEQALLGIDLHPADDIDGVTGAGGRVERISIAAIRVATRPLGIFRQREHGVYSTAGDPTSSCGHLHTSAKTRSVDEKYHTTSICSDAHYSTALRRTSPCQA